MRPPVIALLCCVIPFMAVHIAYIGHIIADTVPVCFPYFEGCLSISRAARSGDFLYVFRAMMMPTSMLFVAYWLLMHGWLGALSDDNTMSTKCMLVLGVVGALFLVLYVTYLGTDGDIYRWMRRYGITVYFSFTALAQILLLRRLYALKSLGVLAKAEMLIRLKLILCLVQWGLGLLSLPVEFIFDEKSTIDAIQNIVEWNFALAMNMYFLLSYFLLKRKKFSVRLVFDK